MILQMVTRLQKSKGQDLVRVTIIILCFMLYVSSMVHIHGNELATGVQSGLNGKPIGLST